MGLAQQANSPGWWHKYGAVLPDWFQVYVGLEEAASLMRALIEGAKEGGFDHLLR